MEKGHQPSKLKGAGSSPVRGIEWIYGVTGSMGAFEALDPGSSPGRSLWRC